MDKNAFDDMYLPDDQSFEAGTPFNWQESESLPVEQIQSDSDKESKKLDENAILSEFEALEALDKDRNFDAVEVNLPKGNKISVRGTVSRLAVTTMSMALALWIVVNAGLPVKDAFIPMLLIAITRVVEESL